MDAPDRVRWNGEEWTAYPSLRRRVEDGELREEPYYELHAVAPDTEGTFPRRAHITTDEFAEAAGSP